MQDYKTRRKNTIAFITTQGKDIYLKRKGSDERVWVGDNKTEIDLNDFWDQYNWWKQGNDGEPNYQLPF